MVLRMYRSRTTKIHVPKLISYVPKSLCTESVHPFVPKLSCTESDLTLFLLPKISAKLKRGHINGGAKCRRGSYKLATFDE